MDCVCLGRDKRDERELRPEPDPPPRLLNRDPEEPEPEPEPEPPTRLLNGEESERAPKPEPRLLRGEPEPEPEPEPPPRLLKGEEPDEPDEPDEPRPERPEANGDPADSERDERPRAEPILPSEDPEPEPEPEPPRLPNGNPEEPILPKLLSGEAPDEVNEPKPGILEVNEASADSERDERPREEPRLLNGEPDEPELEPEPEPESPELEPRLERPELNGDPAVPTPDDEEENGELPRPGKDWRFSSAAGSGTGAVRAVEVRARRTMVDFILKRMDGGIEMKKQRACSGKE